MKKVIKKVRPSWDEYFLAVAEVAGTRATCEKNKNGCVIVLDNRIIATGYTGSLSGLPHCDDVGHKIGDKGECKRIIHAEHNAISQALKFGISLSGATMYCKIKPCAACTQMAASAGIKRVVVQNK